MVNILLYITSSWPHKIFVMNHLLFCNHSISDDGFGENKMFLLELREREPVNNERSNMFQ